MNTTQSLLDLLEAQGVDRNEQRIVLMRHKDERYPLVKYIGTHALTLYQAMQEHRNRMDPGTLLVGIYGHKPRSGLLLGVWRVRDQMPAGKAVTAGLTKGSFEPLDPTWPGVFHDLVETDLLADLRLKLEVEFHGQPNAWKRVLSEPGKPDPAPYAVKIREESAVPFLGLSRVSLVMSELRMALQDVVWQQALSASAGVYLISDELEGRHYVGAAYGAGGLMGRWADYAASGHGGNKLLVQLLEPDANRAMDLRFTVLEALPLGTPSAEAIEREAYWKVALGSRTFGLNDN